MRLEAPASTTVLCAAICIGLFLAPASAEPMIIGNRDGKDIVTVRAVEMTKSKQALPIFPGISGKTAGATGLSLLKVVIPPGGSAEAHMHKGYESAIYLIQGRVETRYGEGLKKSVVNEAGDFIFIPADVPHKPVNLSETEPAIAIVAPERRRRAGTRRALSFGRVVEEVSLAPVEQQGRPSEFKSHAQ